jgi:hypothetical protein
MRRLTTPATNSKPAASAAHVLGSGTGTLATSMRPTKPNWIASRQVAVQQQTPMVERTNQPARHRGTLQIGNVVGRASGRYGLCRAQRPGQRITRSSTIAGELHRL